MNEIKMKIMNIYMLHCGILQFCSSNESFWYV